MKRVSSFLATGSIVAAFLLAATPVLAQGTMFVTDNKVGIGTDTPDAKLDIEDSTQFVSVRFTNTNVSAGTTWEWSAGGGGGGPRFFVKNITAGTTPVKIDADAIHNLFRVGVTGNNNVDILGNLIISGECTEVDGACAPDYVFEPDYDLPSLAELSAFITENKHLPNVPSAAEIESSGVNMRQFNFKLLEKIEELVLYTLDQQQTIDALTARLEALEKRSE